jgi:hypothetical protein
MSGDRPDLIVQTRNELPCRRGAAAKDDERSGQKYQGLSPPFSRRGGFGRFAASRHRFAHTQAFPCLDHRVDYQPCENSSKRIFRKTTAVGIVISGLAK